MASSNAPSSSHTPQPPPLTKALRTAIETEYAGTDPYFRGRRDALRELYESGGLPQAQLALEILYLLPDTFVNAYQELFHTAYLGGTINATQISQTQKSKGNPGTVLGSDNRLQSSGTGKVYKNLSGPAGGARPGSNFAAKTKAAIDQELTTLADYALRSIRSRASSHTRPPQCQGKVPGRNGTVRGCGRFLKAEYRYCPACGTARGD